MTEDLGSQFGASIGEVIRVDADSDGMAWGKCLWVKVAVDLNRPLLTGKWLMMENQKHWISFTNERLQNFCFQCGILSHKGKGYNEQRSYTPEDDLRYMHFGPWIRAQLMNSTIFDSRRYGGSSGSKHHQGWQQTVAKGGGGEVAKDGKKFRVEDTQP